VRRIIGELVNDVTPKGEHLRRAVEWAKTLCAFPQTALRSDRRAVYEGLGTDLKTGLQIEARLGIETMRSGEPLPGAKSFQSGQGRGGKF
jgi:enoyl-CoA hydratase